MVLLRCLSCCLIKVDNEDGGGGLSDYEGDAHPKFNSQSPMEPLATRLSAHEANIEAMLEASKPEAQNGTTAVASTFPNISQLQTGFKEDTGSPGPTRGGPNILPFEFRALEACLEAACSSLDNEVLRTPPLSLLHNPVQLLWTTIILKIVVHMSSESSYCEDISTQSKIGQ